MNRAVVTEVFYVHWVTSHTYPQAGEAYDHDTGGAETPSPMSLLLVWLMTTFFQPQDPAFFATHSAVFMPILKFAIKFRWFKYEPFSIKNLVDHIKCNCTHKI